MAWARFKFLMKAEVRSLLKLAHASPVCEWLSCGLSCGFLLIPHISLIHRCFRLPSSFHPGIFYFIHCFHITKVWKALKNSTWNYLYNI